MHNLVRGYCMNKDRIKKIATLVEKHWEDYPKGGGINSMYFVQEIFQKYKLTDPEWEEVLKECNQRAEKAKRNSWLSIPSGSLVLTILSFLAMGYTSIFFLVSLFYVYTLPSQILFPEGTYIEREQLVNNLNLVVLGLGFLSIYIFTSRKKNK